MNCNKCGTQLPDGFAFCTSCGAKQEPGQAPEQHQSQPQPTPAYPPQQPSGGSWQQPPSNQPPQSFQQSAQPPQQPQPQQQQQQPPSQWGAPPQQQQQFQQPAMQPMMMQPAVREPANNAAGFAYIPFLFWIPLVGKKKDDASKHAVNQGMILSALYVITYFIDYILCDVILYTLSYRIFPFSSTLLTPSTVGRFFSLLYTIFLYIFIAIKIFYLIIGLIGFVKGRKNEKFNVPIFGKINFM